MKSIKLLFSLLVLLTCFTVVMAQSADCPVLVQTAMEKTLDVCSGAQRDQACYGNIALEATFQSGMTDQTFSEPGDVVMVDSLQTLKSIPADTTSELWGVALLRVLADLPDTLPGQAVTMIVFGGMEVGNAIPSHADSADQEMSAASDSVVRAAPSSDGQIVGAMVAGDSAVALGKTADNQWLRVELQDIDRRRGWVSASMMTGADMSTLTVLDPNDLPPSPMQAFYLKPSFRGLDCAQAPDGVLIQTPHVPDGIQLHVTVNDVQIALASTAYIQVETDGFLTVNLLEGHGQVEANDVTVDLPQGYRTRVPVSGDYSAIGSPSPIEAYDAGQMGYLPLGLLPEAITPTSDVWTEGESLCVNKVDGAWMRGTPSSLDQTVVLALVNGQAVAVNGEPQFDGIQSWLPVRTGNINGWVEQSSLTPCDQPVPPPCTPRSRLAVYLCGAIRGLSVENRQCRRNIGQLTSPAETVWMYRQRCTPEHNCEFRANLCSSFLRLLETLCRQRLRHRISVIWFLATGRLTSALQTATIRQHSRRELITSVSVRIYPT